MLQTPIYLLKPWNCYQILRKTKYCLSLRLSIKICSGWIFSIHSLLYKPSQFASSGIVANSVEIRVGPDNRIHPNPTNPIVWTNSSWNYIKIINMDDRNKWNTLVWTLTYIDKLFIFLEDQNCYPPWGRWDIDSPISIVVETWTCAILINTYLAM